jgi:uncharacterized membrane protein YsdA (DUF1294 family)/cold shock CspA family protein
MRGHGHISEWRDAQGYGFITPEDGGERVFVHIRALGPHSRRPSGGERVRFTLAQDERGRLRADRAEFVEFTTARETKTSRHRPLLFAAVAFLAAVAVLAAGDHLPHWVLYVYLGMSVITFGAYAVDKSAAQEDRWRTPEATLQWMSLFCGWPGALIAQQLLRHKSRKRRFLLVFWACVAVNVGVLGWFLLADDWSWLTRLAG